MKLLNQLTDYKKNKDYKDSVVLTIGNFDGVHRGHLAVLDRVKHLAKKNGETVVLTFSNHPSQILRPEKNLQLICSPLHKLKLLEEQNINTVISIEFSRELANRSAASFIEQVHESLSFSHLVLGHDATLGKDRHGDRAIIQELGVEWNFNVHYLDEYCVDGVPVSSTRIRNLLNCGNLENVNLLLDRPYSIYGRVNEGLGKGKEIGFPTANLDVSELCLPPLGVYEVQVKYQSRLEQGIANLGIAPTVKNDSKPVLEVHLFNLTENLYGQYVEVIFSKFIRPEQKFNNIQELREQILKDIQKCKQ